MEKIVVFPGEQLALGQAPEDVCQLGPSRPPGEIPEAMRGLRVGGALFNVPTQPLLLRGIFPTPIPTEEPYPRQVPIYLTPPQASAETAFLTSQMEEPILPEYLRRLFSVPQGS